MPTAAANRPVLVTGCQRSGTTLLSLVLDSHPDITSVDEAVFEPSLLQHYLHDPAFHPLVAFKLPTITHNLAFIRALPNLRLLWLLRDPRDVVLSMLSLPHHRQDGQLVYWVDSELGARREIENCARMLGYLRGRYRSANLDIWERITRIPPGQRTREHQVFAAALCWKLKHEVLARYPTEGIDYHSVRYEDLLQDPATASAALVQYLEIPWDERMLRHHELHHGKSIGNTDNTRAIDPRNRDKWREILGERELELIRQLCGEQARAHGYQLD